jgi:hypothetical protein
MRLGEAIIDLEFERMITHAYRQSALLQLGADCKICNSTFRPSLGCVL